MAPNPKVTTITIQTKRLLQSNHNNVLVPMLMRMSTPPMVGVPALTKCVCTP